MSSSVLAAVHQLAVFWCLVITRAHTTSTATQYKLQRCNQWLDREPCRGRQSGHDIRCRCIAISAITRRKPPLFTNVCPYNLHMYSSPIKHSVLVHRRARSSLILQRYNRTRTQHVVDGLDPSSSQHARRQRHVILDSDRYVT